MKVKENFTLIGISMLFVCALTACDKPGPAETAGKKIDQTAAEASKKIGEATDEIGKKLGKQGEK
jgi:hyperosmotically inducible periplasmic protein